MSAPTAARAYGAWWAFVFLVAACSRPPSSEATDRAEFGIFFGGQIQERDEIPFQLDATKQTQGFRVHFGKPLTRDAAVSWELSMPRVALKSRGKQVSEKQANAGSPHVKVSGQETARAGQEGFEHVLPFKPGDPLGLWNIRIVVGNTVLLDRPFLVYDAEARARASADGGR